jgi:hypothetical protein
MSYKIAAFDVHKKMLAVVVADVAGTGEYEFERRKFAATPDQIRIAAEWLNHQEVQEVVMESTAQYWRPVWAALERYWKPACQKQESRMLHLAQAKSNRGPRGRKNDFADAERLIKRLVGQELRLSFVPDPEQRLWRLVAQLCPVGIGKRSRLHPRVLGAGGFDTNGENSERWDDAGAQRGCGGERGCGGAVSKGGAVAR